MSRRRSLVVIVLATVAWVGAACGSTSASSTGAGPTTTVHVPIPAGPDPSRSAKLVCSDEAQEDLADALGVKVTQPVVATWVDHVYSCPYLYADGTATFSVKEMSSRAETTAYFDMLGQKLGNTGSLNGLGQGAFATDNGSVVVRKDYKVLLVDVSGLPSQFGVPPTSSADVAVTMADVIMGCWSGE